VPQKSRPPIHGGNFITGNRFSQFFTAGKNGKFAVCFFGDIVYEQNTYTEGAKNTKKTPHATPTSVVRVYSLTAPSNYCNKQKHNSVYIVCCNYYRQQV